MGGSVKRFTACLLALCLLTSQLGISFSDGVIVSAENTQTAEETPAAELLTDENNENEVAAAAAATVEETAEAQSAADFIAEDAAGIAAAGSLEEARTLLSVGAEGIEQETASDEAGAEAGTQDGDSANEEGEDTLNPDSQEGSDTAAEENSENTAPEDGAASDVKNTADAEADSDEQNLSDAENTVDVEADSDEQDASAGDVSDDTASDDQSEGEDASGENAVISDAENTDEETSADMESEEAIADSLTAGEEEALEEEDKEPVTYTAETVNGIEVTVVAPGGVLPDDVTLVAALLGSSEDESASAVGDALANHDISYDGYVAIDVHFEDGTGTEVEPDGAVAVSFSLPEGLLPEGAQNLEVQHLKEDGNGNVTEVETVAAENDGGSPVSVADDGSVVAEFEVEEFSSFTITYNYSADKSLSLTVYCIYEDESATDNANITTVSGVTQADFSISSETNINDLVDTYLQPTSAVKFLGAVAEATPAGAKEYYIENGSSGKYSVAGLTSSSSKVQLLRGDNGKTQNFDDEHPYLYLIFSKCGETLTPGYYVKSASTGSYTVSNTGAITFDMDKDYYSSALAALAYDATGVTYAYAVVASSETEAATAEAITDLKYDSSSGNWYYVLSDGTSGTLDTAKRETIYFVYGLEKTFLGAVLTYKSLSNSVSISASLYTTNEDVDITLIADTAYQVNKLSFKTAVDNTSYFYGKDFSYAVVCSDNQPFSSSITGKVTYIRYNYSESKWQYLTSDSTSANDWKDFDSNDKLYFLYYANAMTFGTLLSDYIPVGQSQSYVTVEADESYTASDIIGASYPTEIDGYECTGIVYYTGSSGNTSISASDYTDVNRIMYASTYSEEIGSSMSGNAWYYNISESAGKDDWAKIDDLSYLYYLYEKKDIKINYADGISNETTDNKILTSITYPGTSVVETATIKGGTGEFKLKTPDGGTFTENGVTYQYVWDGWTFASGDQSTYDALNITLSTYVSGTVQTLTIPSAAVVTNNEITIYSSYTISPVYEVTYIWDDSSLVPDGIALPNSEILNAAGSITLPTFNDYAKNVAVKDSDGVIYTWLGWYYTDSQTNELVEISSTKYVVSESVTLTGKWSKAVNVNLRLSTNFVIAGDSTEETTLKDYFQGILSDTSIKANLIEGIEYTGSSLTAEKEGSKYLLDDEIGTATPEGTIVLPSNMQGTEITIKGSGTYNYIFGGWQVYNEKTGNTLDLDRILDNANSDKLGLIKSSGYTDSSSGLTFRWDESRGLYYVTVPPNGIEIRAALFKETKTWTANTTELGDILTIEREGVNFSSTDANLGYVTDIEVYIWNGNSGAYDLVTKYNKDGNTVFYFSYDNYACVDLSVTLADSSPYYIVGLGYTVCYGSSGPNSAKWYEKSGGTVTEGKSSFYLDNVRDASDGTTSTVKIYLAKMYTIQYEIYDETTNQKVSDYTSYISLDSSSGVNLTLDSSSLVDSNIYSAVSVYTNDIQDCTSTGLGHQVIKDNTTYQDQNCLSHGNNGNDQAETVKTAFSYTLTSGIKLANASGKSTYTLSDWYLVVSSTGAVSSMTYTQGAGVTLDQTMTSQADANNVIILRAFVSNSAVPTGVSTDAAPYVLLFGTGTAAGVLLLAAGWKRKRRRRVLRGELDRYSRGRRGRRNEW